METKQDLQKLTVPQLKEKLKQRHLTTSGAKSELVDRLIESIQEEEKLLVGTEATEDLDVDDLLGTNSTEPSLTSNEEALLLGLPSKASKPADAPKAVVPTQKPESKPAAPSVLPTKPAIQEPPASKPEISSPKNGVTAEKPEEESEPKRIREPIRPKVSTDNSEDARKRRAERFGLPVKSAEQKSSTETTTPATPTTPVASEKPSISLNSSTKLLERAKRFGLPVQQDSSGDTNGASNPKIPRITSTDQDEAKQRRLKRFAQT